MINCQLNKIKPYKDECLYMYILSSCCVSCGLYWLYRLTITSTVFVTIVPFLSLNRYGKLWFIATVHQMVIYLMFWMVRPSGCLTIGGTAMIAISRWCCAWAGPNVRWAYRVFDHLSAVIMNFRYRSYYNCGFIQWKKRNMIKNITDEFAC